MLGGWDGGLLALRGPVVAWGSIAAVALAFGLAVWIAPRLPARGRGAALRARIVQAIVLLVCTATALVATGVWVNRALVAYGSWADLLDGGSQIVSSRGYGAPVREDPGALASARTAPVTPQQGDPLHDPALRGLPGGSGAQTITVTIPGRSSDVTQEALVRLPAGYMDSPTTRYPVLLAFSGTPGSPATWMDALHLGERMDALTAQGRLAPAILVIPVVYPGRLDTECVDPSSGHQRYETWLADDVPAWIRTHLRTIEDPRAWATIGYSAGGWCATMLSVRHPDLARASISLGGYFQVLYTRGQEWTGPDEPAYDLPALVAREQPPVAMYAFAGGEDPLPRRSLPRMERAVRGPTPLTVERTPHGAHSLTSWDAQVPRALTWLAGHEAGFAPAR